MRLRTAGMVAFAGVLLVLLGLLARFATAPEEVAEAPVAAMPGEGSAEEEAAEPAEEPSEEEAAEQGEEAGEADARDEALRKAGKEPPVEEVVRLTGRVVDPDGEPVAGASVLFGQPLTPWPLDAPGPEGSREPLRTRTEGDGSFFFEPVPSGSFALAVRRAGFTPLDVEPLLLSGEPHDLGQLELTESVVLRGRVVDVESRPVADAVLVALPDLLPGAPDELNARNGRRVATTDDQGQFEVRELRSGDWRLLVSSALHPEAVFEGRADALDGPVEGLVFSLAEGALIRGRLVDVDLAAEGPLWVHAAPLRAIQTDEGEYEARTPEIRAGFRRAPVDEWGTFELAGLTPFEVFGLRVLKAGQPTTAKDAFSDWTHARAGGPEVELSYAPSATLGFVVTNRYDGAPVERFELELRRAWPETLRDEHGDPVTFHPGGSVELRGIRPQLRTDDPRFANVPQGDELTLRVRAEGHEAFKLENLVVTSGEHARLGALRLTPLPTLTVRVVEVGSGEPVEGASVSCTGRPAMTDASGLASVSFPLEDVAQVVAALEGRRAEAEVPMAACNAATPFELRLERQPDPGAVLVQVTDMGGNPLRLHWVLVASPIGSEKNIASRPVDAGGRASFPVAPGTHGFRTVARPRLGRLEDPPVYWQPVTVRAGEEVELTLFGQRLEAVLGRLMLDGLPVADARLRLQSGGGSQLSVGAEWESTSHYYSDPAYALAELGYAADWSEGRAGLTARTDGEGRFAFEDLAPGLYSLLVDHPASGVRTRLDLEADSVEHVLDLDASSARGRVFDGLGLAVEGARVLAYAETRSPSINPEVRSGTLAGQLGRHLTPFAETRTDRFGEYVLDVLPPSLDACVVVYAGQSSGAAWRIRAAPGERLRDVDIDVFPLSMLDVRVDVPDEAELAGNLGVLLSCAYRPAGLGNAFAWLDADGGARFTGLDLGEWQAALLLFDPLDRVVDGGRWTDLKIEPGRHHELVLEWPFGR